MPMPEDTMRVVCDYHQSWIARDFPRAAALLAEDLTVEVPVNHYATRDAFAAALASFAGMVERVELLSQLAREDEAMLLYDMTVTGIGPLRIAEHFTVKDGRIVRLRQIHDTMAIRSAGLGG